jgi:DNA-binding NarL/FixJ family response regulator
MPRRKPSKRIHAGKIRVLLVDEEDLARRAWKRILQKSSQIEVMGECKPGVFFKEMQNTPEPEVVVAGFSYVSACLAQLPKFQRLWGNVPRTIIICQSKLEIKEAFKAGAEWTVAIPFDDQELVTRVRASSDDAKRLCSDYLSALHALRGDSASDETYLKLIQDILQLLFHPDLVNPERMHVPDRAGRTQHGRLVFRNQAKSGSAARSEHDSRFNEFWEEGRQGHNAKYVTVDVYNAEVTAPALQALGNYLGPLHGTLGLIVGRDPIPSRLSRLAVALFENEKKAILTLGSAEIEEMLEYKAGGVNPTCLLQDLYQRLIADAES